MVSKLTVVLLAVLAGCSAGQEANAMNDSSATEHISSQSEEIFSETKLEEMLQGTAEQQRIAIERITAEPQLVNPFTLAQVVSLLMKRGDNLQAAFWYYVWQARTGPWVQPGSPGGYGPLRGAMTESLGGVVNQWIASDPDAMAEVGARALSFERRMPLYPGRPDGVGEAEWIALVDERRRISRAGFDAVLPLDDAGKAEWREKRRQADLPVGPLEQTGAPLPDNWR